MQEFDNPVYDTYLADPFCWRHDGVYYAIGTGKKETGDEAAAGRVVPIVRSVDLRHWEPLGTALMAPKEEWGGAFWAPETAFHDGRFYLYYHPSGNGKGFHVRVAVSETPEGPYVDTGVPMTDVEKNPFCIDSHAFQDDDGQWYLFYATDFLDSDETTFRGTALVVDKMIGMTALEGNPTVVMRAHWQWQCFERNREMAGKCEDWYTLEGPCVRKRDGKYYCFYAGGCYQNETYGVDYLVADHVLGPWTEVGGERGPQIMRSIPGEVIGPGHLSIVSSPKGQDYVVYHAWNEAMTDRLMCIDPLEWTPQGPRVPRFARQIERVSS
jgi:beta-xylosidase